MDPGIIDFCKGLEVVPVCPEMLGQLGCPREKHEIRGGTGKDVLSGSASVISISGKDRTAEFLSGARETLRLGKANECGTALLKEHSPSCAVREIHSGRFDGSTIQGPGVTAALLEMSGVRIMSETDV